MAQLPKGGLLRGRDKPIHWSCAIYFSGGIVERLFSFWDAIYLFHGLTNTSARLQSPSSETCHKVPAINGTDGKRDFAFTPPKMNKHGARTWQQIVDVC